MDCSHYVDNNFCNTVFETYKENTMQLVEVAVSTQQYVNYDKKTGEVKSVGPNKDLDYSSIEVSEKEIEPLRPLKETMS